MSQGTSSFWEARGFGIFAVVSFDQENPTCLEVFEKGRRITCRASYTTSQRASAEARLSKLVGKLRGIPELGLEATPDLADLVSAYFSDTK